ncbi:PREDICTED: TALPID3 protein-like, partial [Tauraco erythrolophus]|uniref:TALPID3 protein-like n=1 Tax=Tauraco erythrolophus TaxID=121530 RepID=UPI0005238CA2
MFCSLHPCTSSALLFFFPLLQVQNDLEAKVNSVSALIHKLQETDRQLQRVAEQQTNTKAQHEKPHCHERVSELEKQMNAFMVQRIQHLEKLQEQQMNIQSHLVSSAVSTSGLRQIHVPSASLVPKQSEKPEQQSLTNDVSSWQRGLFPTSGPLAAQAYSSQFQNRGIHTQKSPLKTPVPRRCAPEPVSKNEASSWKSDMNNLIKSKKPAAASDLPERHLLNKPSILRNVKVPKSILKDAERILRGVQNNKKVLEENLEAVIRAKDGDAFINAITTNRDVLEEIRIRKTVDEWIKAISVEIQAEMARNDLEQVKYDQKVPWIKRTQSIKAMKTNKEIKAKTQKIQGCLTKKPLSAAKPLQKQAEDNMSKRNFRTHFSESLQRKEKRAD